MDKIYIVRGTEQSGPFTEAEIRAQLASGALTSDSMVWWEGLPEWTPISGTPLAAPAAASGPLRVAPVQTPEPSAVVADSGKKKTSGLAITSLICGCCGFLCTIILGVAAVITGHMARKQIRQDPSLGGSGMALAGIILGYIWIAAFVIIVPISVLIALGNQVQGVFSTISSQVSAEQMTNSAPAAPDSDTNAAPTNSAPATSGQ